MDLFTTMMGELVTGVEVSDDPEDRGLYKVYIGPRYTRIYVLVDAEDGERIKAQFHGSSHHLLLRVPKEAPRYQDPEESVGERTT